MLTKAIFTHDAEIVNKIARLLATLPSERFTVAERKVLTPNRQLNHKTQDCRILHEIHYFNKA